MDLAISAILALLIHVAPIGLKLSLDPLYHISLSAWAILIALCLLQISLMMMPGKVGRWLATLLVLPLAFSTLLNALSLSIFASPISLSGVVSILQSNPHEAMEFTEAYQNRILGTTFIIGLVFLSLLLAYLKQPPRRTNKAAILSLALALMAATPLLSKAWHSPKLAAWDLHEVAYTDRVLTSLLRYRGQMLAWDKERARWQNRGNVAKDLQLKVVDGKKLAPLVIVVIGESTTRTHMGLYGYHRPTTPILEAMKDDLIVFHDVITPTAHTIPAVMGALCSKKLTAGEINCTAATLIDIARGAGYQVTWISNQTQIGFDDNSIVHLGRSADKSVFVNQDASSAAEADRNTSLDEKVLAPLDEAIAAAPGGKNMIFIHLMGAHFTYEKRYPQDARKFADDLPQTLDPIVKDQGAAVLINNYDNAIAYQDKVLGQIFKRIKQSKQEALGLYFSDHGEEVYSSKNFHGHSDDNLTPAMSEIPFILTASEAYIRNHHSSFERMRQDHNRPFITSRLTPSIADLLGLSYAALQHEQSLFSSEFKAAPRQTAKGAYKSSLPEQFGQR